MSDHHVDSMHIDYSEAAKKILQRHGLLISDAPPINHKPGNDFLSDWIWPLPTYPDTRFLNIQNSINVDKDDDGCDCGCGNPECDCDSNKFRFPTNFEILSDEIKQFKGLQNPVLSFDVRDRDGFIDKAVYPYTGLVLQGVEKRAFNVSFVKPFFDENGKRHTQLFVKEVIEGHPMSIATFDGWNYHIYRGVCRYILTVDPPKSVNGKLLRPRTVPFGKNIIEKEDLKNPQQDMISRNMKIILDCSRYNMGEIANIPINQIIDIEEPDYVYDFTIYEGGLKVFWDDWTNVEAHTSVTAYTYIPGGTDKPQTLHHEVIEHQKRTVRRFVKMLSDTKMAIQYNSETVKQIIYRLKRYHIGVAYDGRQLIIENNMTHRYEEIEPLTWLLIDDKEKMIYGMYSNEDFIKVYGA